MKLYHFCTKESLESIKKEGLTLGVIPVKVGSEMKEARGFQWLTKNPDISQGECRITIKIPKTSKDIISWDELRKLLNGASIDNPDWYVYNGRIKPNYFREIK